jgi:hypothetical protein
MRIPAGQRRHRTPTPPRGHVPAALGQQAREIQGVCTQDLSGGAPPRTSRPGVSDNQGQPAKHGGRRRGSIWRRSGTGSGPRRAPGQLGGLQPSWQRGNRDRRGQKLCLYRRLELAKPALNRPDTTNGTVALEPVPVPRKWDATPPRESGGQANVQDMKPVPLHAIPWSSSRERALSCGRRGLCRAAGC